MASRSPSSRAGRPVRFSEATGVALLFIAMPMKYVGDMPQAVRLVGSVHGGLFVLLAWLVVRSLGSADRGLAWGARIGVASLLPFGTFFLDRRLRLEDEAYRRDQQAG